MKTISKTKISTADYAWNPVVGCSRNCPKCWAKGTFRRFADQTFSREMDYLRETDTAYYYANYTPDGELKGFTLESLKKFEVNFLYHQFAKRFPEKASRICVGWMSDFSEWTESDLKSVLSRIMDNNHYRSRSGFKPHRFQFLTKSPGAYLKNFFPKNCDLGFTARTQDEFDKASKIMMVENFQNNRIFAYLEPMMEGISIHNWLQENSNQSESNPNIAVAAGGMNGKGTHRSPFQWFTFLYHSCHSRNVPFYFKGPGGNLEPEFDGEEFASRCKKWLP